MLIGVSGKLGSGKDTFAEKLTRQIPELRQKSFAFKLKQVTALLTGQKLEDMFTQEGKNIYLQEWGMTVGEFQQKMGTEGMRQGVHENGWVLSLFSDYTDNSSWIVTDVRFPNEAAAIRNRGGYLVRIEGDPNKTRASSTRDLNHASETSLDDWTDWEYKFTNEPPLSNLDKHVNTFISIINS